MMYVKMAPWALRTSWGKLMRGGSEPNQNQAIGVGLRTGMPMIIGTSPGRTEMLRKVKVFEKPCGEKNGTPE
jgi:hypothetical protein